MPVEFIGTTTLKDPEPWAIKGTVGGVTVLWGTYGSYKTFVAVSMALAVASGRSWFGKPVREGAMVAGGPVLYVLGEGGSELFKRRVSAAAAELGIGPEELKGVPLAFTTTSCDMSTPEKLETLWVEWDPVSPVMVVVDTVSRALTGDENKQEAMQAFVASLDAVRARYGASVLAVHHANRAGQIRGSNVLPSGADVVLRVWRGSQESGVRRTLHLKADKLKDLDTDEFYPTLLYPNVVNVRHEDGALMLDEFGDQVTTLVLRESQEALERESVALAILEHLSATRDKDTTVGYKEWMEASGQSKTTFQRAVQGLLAAKRASLACRGQYWLGDREQKFFDPGVNFDTTEDEKLRADVERLKDEVDE